MHAAKLCRCPDGGSPVTAVPRAVLALVAGGGAVATGHAGVRAGRVGPGRRHGRLWAGRLPLGPLPAEHPAGWPAPAQPAARRAAGCAAAGPRCLGRPPPCHAGGGDAAAGPAGRGTQSHRPAARAAGTGRAAVARRDLLRGPRSGGGGHRRRGRPAPAVRLRQPPHRPRDGAGPWPGLRHPAGGLRAGPERPGGAGLPWPQPAGAAALDHPGRAAGGAGPGPHPRRRPQPARCPGRAGTACPARTGRVGGLRLDRRGPADRGLRRWRGAAAGTGRADLLRLGAGCAGGGRGRAPHRLAPRHPGGRAARGTHHRPLSGHRRRRSGTGPHPAGGRAHPGAAARRRGGAGGRGDAARHLRAAGRRRAGTADRDAAPGRRPAAPRRQPLPAADDRRRRPAQLPRDRPAGPAPPRRRAAGGAGLRRGGGPASAGRARDAAADAPWAGGPTACAACCRTRGW